MKCYTILIGKAEFDEEKRKAVVKRIELPEAPSFPHDETGNSNCRHVPCDAWHTFLQETGLKHFFLKEHCLMSEAGVEPISLEEFHTIEEVRFHWQLSYPDATPGYGEGDDLNLAYLLWLEWWMRWALEHHILAAIYNDKRSCATLAL